MAQLEHIEAIEKRLWGAADTLRANSNYASNEYFLPVMGLVFLRHAYSRFLAVKDNIEVNLPTRGGKTRALTKEDFSQKSAIFLQPEAQFEHLVALPDSEDRDQVDKYIELVSGYCRRTLNEGAGCFKTKNDKSDAILPLPDFVAALKALTNTIKAFKMILPAKRLLDAFSASVSPIFDQIETLEKTNIGLTKARDLLLPRLMNGEISV